MHSCSNCKLALEPGTIYCPRCGRKLVADAAVRHRQPTDPFVRAALIESKSLEAVGSWEGAVEKCMEALKKAPDNPEIYSSLGEIYESQRRIDQALQWYQLAEVEYAGSGEVVPGLREKIQDLESRRTILNQTTGWFDRYVGARKFSASVRVLTFALFGFLVLLVLGAVFVIISNEMMDRAQLQSSAQEVQPKDDVEPLVRQPVSGGENRSQAELQYELTLEQKINLALMRHPMIKQRNVAITGVKVDPDIEQLSVDFTVSPFAGRATKMHVLSDSAVVCAVAYSVMPDVGFVTLEAYADIPGAAGGPKLQKLFVADTTRKTAEHADPSMPKDQLEKLFLNPMWSPSINQ